MLNQWRTVGVGALGIVTLLLGLVVTGHWPSAGGSFPAFALAVGGCVSAVAAKAGWQHSANANAAKPEEPKP